MSKTPEKKSEKAQNPKEEQKPQTSASNPGEESKDQATSNYVPSSFITENRNLQFIDFTSYPHDFYELIKDENFESALPFRDKPLNESFDLLVNEFDKTTVTQILCDPSDVIRDFTEYVKGQIISEGHKFLAIIWPPLLPNNDYKIIIYFLIKILHTLGNHLPFLAWLSSCVYPNTFTRDKQADLIAITPCHILKKKNLWASLDGQHVFKLYHYENGDYVADVNAEATQVTVSGDGSITVSGANGVLSTFSPDAEKAAALWHNVLEDQNHFGEFLTLFSNPTIDDFYTSAYDAIANADVIILKAILSPSVTDPASSESKKLMRTLTDIFTYAQKLVPFYNAVINNDLGDFGSNYIDCFSKPCHTKNMFQCLFDDYGQPYIDNFVKLLSAYIDSTNGFGIESSKPEIGDVERLVNNIVKYVCQSFAVVPPQIQLVLNIIRTSLVVRTNSRSEIYRPIAEIFLIQFLCGVLNNIKKYVPTAKKPSLYKKISSLLETVFAMGQMNGEFTIYASMTKRLERHVFPRLMEFIFAISEPNTVDPEYAAVNEKKLPKQIEEVLKVATSKPEQYIEAFRAVTQVKEAPTRPSTLGENFAGTLCNFFLHGNDIIEAAEEVENHQTNGDNQPRHHHKLVKLELTQGKDGDVVEKRIKRDPEEIVDPSKPRKYYKRVVKKVPL